MRTFLGLCGATCALLILSHAASGELATKGRDMSGLTQSAHAIEAILTDLQENYSGAGGGGIGHIRQRSTSTYEATVLEEEQEVIFFYKFSFGADGSLSIETRTETTQ